MSPAHDDRSTRVLEAASDLFLRFGYSKTNVEEIARSAGISKGAVYLEFPGKEALFDALVRWEFQRYLNAVVERVNADPVGGRLSRVYRHSVDELLTRPFLQALYTRDDHVLGSLLQRRGPARYGPRVLLGTEYVRRLQGAGLVRAELSPHVLAHTMSVLSAGLLLAEPLLADGTEPRLEDTLDLLSEVIVTAVEPVDGGGDLDAGKVAFSELCEYLNAAIERDD